MEQMTLGAQLYTLRDYTQNERDLDYCLGRVAEMGYETVQLSCVGPIDPHRIRELCDAHGLKIVLTHADPNRILHDTEAVIRENDIYGCDFIGLGGMPPRYCTEEWIDRFAVDYKLPAQKIAAAGKRFVYHNHAFDFRKIRDGRRQIEILLDAFAPEELGLTLDTYWVQMAGCDVLQWIDRLEGRIPCVHLKDVTMKPRIYDNIPMMMPVGEGNMNFPAILERLRRSPDTRHLLVEQDVCMENAFRCLETSYKNIRKMGF